MADVKLKPKMNKPKILVKNYVVKEAESILKAKYKAQQEKREQIIRDPVREATERIEQTVQDTNYIAARTLAAKTRNKQKKDSKRQTTVVDNDSSTLYTEELLTDILEPQQAFATSFAELPNVFTPEQIQQQKINQALRTTVKEKQQQRIIQKKEVLRENTISEQIKQEGDAVSFRKNSGSQIKTTHSQFVVNKSKAQNTVQSYLRSEQRDMKSKNTSTPLLFVEKGSKPQKIKMNQTVISTGNSASATAVSSIPTSAERAKQYVQRKAQQKMFYQTIWQRQQNVRNFTDWTTKVGGVITRTFRSVSSSLLSVSGGVMLLVTVMLVAMIAAMAASPFGIFFSGENPGPDAVPVSVAVAMLNQEYTVQLETLQNGANYDDIIIHGMAPDWPEILAVFATKVAGGTGTEAADVVTIDKTRIEQLKAVFWDMVAITSDTEVIQHSGANENDVGWTEKILHITIQTKNAEKMAEQYNFGKQQKSALQELLAQRAMLLALAGTTAIISADADALLKNLPENLSVERKAVIKAACSLVGKVNYFWGGKSLTLGWNSAWGELRKVTATGSPTTGTYRPYGLDCSGFVDWAFLMPQMMII